MAPTAFGLGFQQVIHDGKIVRRQVPDDIDVVLEESEIDARGIVIEDLSEDALIDHLADFAHGTGEQEGVIDHDLQLFAGRQIDQLGGFGRGRSERFLDEYMFAVFERGFGELEVGPNGGDDGDCVDVRGPDDLGSVAGDQDPRVRFSGPFLRGGIGIANGGQLTAVGGLKVPRHHGAPVTIADDTDSNHDPSRKAKAEWPQMNADERR